MAQEVGRQERGAEADLEEGDSPQGGGQCGPSLPYLPTPAHTCPCLSRPILPPPVYTSPCPHLSVPAHACLCLACPICSHTCPHLPMPTPVHACPHLPVHHLLCTASCLATTWGSLFLVPQRILSSLHSLLPPRATPSLLWGRVSWCPVSRSLPCSESPQGPGLLLDCSYSCGACRGAVSSSWADGSDKFSSGSGLGQVSLSSSVISPVKWAW